MIKIVNFWRIVISGSAYTAPELRRFHLQGLASWLPDGENCLTSSPIVGSEENGKVIITRSGSRYTLGTPFLEGQKSFEGMISGCPYIPLR